nr:hypothetical protein BaRGS_005074 [Batillaria attramentaria]
MSKPRCGNVDMMGVAPGRGRSDLGHQSRKREVLHPYAAENASEFQSGIWRAVSRQGRQPGMGVLAIHFQYS